jgi:2'-5' RNA ligase
MASEATLLRLFVGVKARSSPALAAGLERLSDMGKAVRPVREDQLHLTLKFLGDVEKSLVPAIAEGMTRAVASADAFDWALRGTGAFPSSARPSVIWAGADAGDRFASLAEQIESACEPLGFPRETRPFRAHVTLARVRFRPPPALAEWLHETADAEFGPQRAEEVVLFRSELGPGGSVYTPVHVVKLASS